MQPLATLVVLNDGFTAVGAAQSLLLSFPDLAGTVYDHWCVGSNAGWPGCPSVGTDVLIAQATISIMTDRGTPVAAPRSGRSVDPTLRREGTLIPLIPLAERPN